MTDTKITKNDDSTVTIEGEIHADALAKHREPALKKLGEKVTLDGFRPGHVPEDMLIQHVGEYALLEEMANRALSEHYPMLIMEHKIDAIGRPEVSITKLAMGNPLEYKITTAVMPTIALGDYKTVAKKVLSENPTTEPTVEDTDVEGFVKNLLADYKQNVPAEAEGTESATPAPTELTDEIAKTFGNFENAADMRAKIKEGMLGDKKREAIEKRRLLILEALIAETPFPLPAVVIDAETDKLFARFSMDLKRMGLDMKGYLERIKKTEEDVRAEMRPDAEKRGRIQLLINEIALAEKLVPNAEEVKVEVDRMLADHPPHEGHDDTRERESATLYVATILTNEKVLKFLEEQK
jgi:FKBP-type peptidyl-prolyl cis-trans isomerase (trigger factor)